MLTIIYSLDDSTQFLSKIPENLSKHPISSFPILPETNDEEIYLFIENIKEKQIILFLGHGGSSYLCRENRKQFITKDHLKYFDNKFFFCLSCDSQEFLGKNFKQNSILNAIGFGDLPTDWNDILGKREYESEAYKGINETIISSYREILVELIINSFTDMFRRELDFKGLGNFFLIRLNKKISEVILKDKSNEENRILANLLFETKSQMRRF